MYAGVISVWFLPLALKPCVHTCCGQQFMLTVDHSLCCHPQFQRLVSCLSVIGGRAASQPFQQPQPRAVSERSSQQPAPAGVVVTDPTSRGLSSAAGLQPQLVHLDQLLQQGQVCQADTFKYRCSVQSMCNALCSQQLCPNVAVYLVKLL